jgi:hypothetical protein
MTAARVPVHKGNAVAGPFRRMNVMRRLVERVGLALVAWAHKGRP